MRHLTVADVASTIERGATVEAFCGRSPLGSAYLRYIQLRGSAQAVDAWVYDVEDIGGENLLDLHAFPLADPDLDGPHARYASLRDAMEAARIEHGVETSRWVNEGVAQSEYLDFIRAGRPGQWPSHPA